LERLDLGYNRLRGASLEGFGRSSSYPALRYLALHGNLIAESTVERFLETPTGRQLTAFGFSLDTASDDLALRLRERFGDNVY
jgi:hypothetical protein